jgi:hypothetical protein
VNLTSWAILSYSKRTLLHGVDYTVQLFWALSWRQRSLDGFSLLVSIHNVFVIIVCFQCLWTNLCCYLSVTKSSVSSRTLSPLYWYGNKYKNRNRSNSTIRAGIAQWYSAGLRTGWSRVRVPEAVGNFSLHHYVQTDSGAHPASYPMGTMGSFPGAKADGAWS